MQSSETKICQNCNQNFVIEPDDFAYYERLDLPLPDKCPYCRWKHLLAFWVFGKFRIAKSALSGKSIITVFPESVKFPLYDHKEWISDAWDPLSYGQKYDSNRPFFEQFGELQAKMPHPHTSGINNFNCDWSDDSWNCKNCYLSRSMEGCEDLTYCYRALNSKNSIDLTYSFDMEQSYDCFYCFKCYSVSYSFNSRDCIDSAFLADCRNCQNCFMSWNLRNKKYYILNKPYSKEEYFAKLKEFKTFSYASVQKLKQEFDRIIREDVLHRANFNVQTVNSSGNFLDKVKNCHNTFFVSESENVRNSFRGWDCKDAIDIVGSIAEKSALSVMDGYLYDSVATSHCGNCRYMRYSEYCEDCESCFGCIGLRKKKYCILNTQYTEIEYKTLVEKIKSDMKQKGEWGKFFPLPLAYSGYNLTLGQLFFPETKERIVEVGGKWEEPQPPEYKDAIPAETLPDRIGDVTDDIISKRIICPETKLSYNIAQHELTFYRQHGIPLPRRHFDWRTLSSFKPMTYMIYPQKGICWICKKEIEHYYGPELGYKKIACVECYQKEVA